MTDYQMNSLIYSVIIFEQRQIVRNGPRPYNLLSAASYIQSYELSELCLTNRAVVN